MEKQKNTIELIENDFWEDGKFDSHLVATCHKLRKKNLDEFEIEDLRIMIGQNIALPTLVPIAITKLENNIFAEGDFYPGDLLRNLLKSSKDFWTAHTELKQKLILLFEKNQNKIHEVIFAEEIIAEIQDAFEDFKRIT